MAVGARQVHFGLDSDVGSRVADLRSVVDKGRRTWPVGVSAEFWVFRGFGRILGLTRGQRDFGAIQ